MKTQNKLLASILLTAGIVSSPNISYAADSKELEDLRAQIEELKQSIKVIDRKGELAEEAAAAKKKETPIVKAGDGFGFKSADGQHEIKFKALAHIDYRGFLDDGSDTKNTSGFDFRRIRPSVEGTVYGIYDFKFTPEFGENKTGTGTSTGTSDKQNSFKGNSGIVDAWIDAKFQPWFQVQAGKLKPDVGLERLQSGSNIKLIERSWVSNSILPNRDLGINIHGDFFENKLHYGAGLFNGVVDGGDNVTTQDSNSNKEVALRLFATPFKDQVNALQGLGFGIAGTYAHSNGAGNGPTNPNSVTGLPSDIKTPGQQAALITYFAGTSSTNSAQQAGNKIRWTPQLYYYNGSFGLLGEYAQSRFDVISGAGGFRANGVENDAWHITGSWLVTGENASFGSVKPKNAYNPNGSGWGAWEIVARYQEINVDDKLFAQNGSGNTYLSSATQSKSAQAWAFGVNWYLNNNVKIAANYEDTNFGDSVSGAALTTSVTRPNERSLFTRLQLSY
jgi:phosphate-selective porin OprO/OprP